MFFLIVRVVEFFLLTVNFFSVFVAGQVLKKLLATFPDKVRGQEALSGKKAALLYNVLDAYPQIYRVVPDKSVRSRMNMCFRVTKVRIAMRYQIPNLANPLSGR